MAKSVAAAAGALVVATGLAGCGSGAEALSTHTAQVTINGQDTGVAHPITCNQFGWDWKVETLEETPGFMAMFQTGEPMVAEAVVLRQLGDFTGSFWRYTVGDAQLDVSGRNFTMTGTAVGHTAEQPAERTTATFTIKTNC